MIRNRFLVAGILVLLVTQGVVGQDPKRKDKADTVHVPESAEDMREEAAYKLGVWIANYFFGLHLGQELGKDFGQKGNPGNPTPDSTSSGEKDMDMLIQLLKQHGGPVQRVEAFEGTPLGKKMIASGKGKVPVWNPAEFKARENAYAEAMGVSGGFDPNAGSPASQLKQGINKAGAPKGGSGDKGSTERRRQQLGLYTDDMPGPPAIVYPQWRRMIAAATATSTNKREEAIFRVGLSHGITAATAR